MRHITRFVCLLMFVAALSAATVAQSQATTGLIQGTVVDPNGAVVSGASINVKNLGTGFERTVTSNSDGFLLPLVAARQVPRDHECKRIH